MYDKKINLQPRVSYRMFQIFDSENQNQLSFSDFIDYLNMLLNGTQNEKSKFIFDIITQRKTDRFSKKQIFEFYKFMKEDQDQENFFESISEE